MNPDNVEQIEKEINELKQTLKKSTDYFLEFSMHLFQNKRKELLQIKANLNNELRIYTEHEQDTEEDYQFLREIETKIENSANPEKNRKKLEQALVYLDKNQATTRRRIDTLANNLLPKLETQLKVVEQKINNITKKINIKSLSEEERLSIVEKIDKLELQKEELLSNNSEENNQSKNLLLEDIEIIPNKKTLKEEKVEESNTETLSWDMPKTVEQPKIENTTPYNQPIKKKKTSYRIRSYKEATAAQIIGSIDIMTGLGFETSRYCTFNTFN